MHLLWLPLHGAFFVITLAILLTKLVALVDAATRSPRAYALAGKRSKQFWVWILVAAVVTSFLGFLNLVGLVAALVYLVDVRPAVRTG
jgi:uncharacterized membrane protein YkvI